MLRGERPKAVGVASLVPRASSRVLVLAAVFVVVDVAVVAVVDMVVDVVAVVDVVVDVDVDADVVVPPGSPEAGPCWTERGPG